MAATDDLYTDKELAKARDKTMDHLKAGPKLHAVSRFILMIGGPILTAGVMGLIGFGTAGTGLVAGAILAGAALTGIGIAIEYNGIRNNQSGHMDQVEVGAKSTARHLVEELKSQNMCQTFEQNARKDGKSWVQATGRGDAGQQPQLS